MFVLAGGLYADRGGQDDLAALRYLSEALRRDPRSPVLHYRLGFLLQKMNRKKEAEAEYRAALERNPCHLQALNNLGTIQLDLGRTAAAETFYRRALRCDPAFYAANFNLGNIFKKDQKIEEAAEQFRRVLRVNAGHAGSHHNLGIVYFELAGRGGQRGPEFERLALRHLEQSVTLRPGDALGRYNFAKVLASAGQTGRALRELKTAERYAARAEGFRSQIRREYDRLRAAAR